MLIVVVLLNLLGAFECTFNKSKRRFVRYMLVFLLPITLPPCSLRCFTDVTSYLPSGERTYGRWLLGA